MKRFKEICKKIGIVLEYIVGTAFMLCLFLGGLGFIGYCVAFCIGGELATKICIWIYKTYYVWLIKTGTVSTLLAFLSIYMKGEADWNNPFKYWLKKKSNKEV